MKKENEKGFITYIILIIIALVALKYAFHFDVVEYWHTTQVQGYVHTGEAWVKTIYDWVDTTVGKYIPKGAK